MSTSDTVCDPTSPVARTYSVRSLCYTVVHSSRSLDLFPCSHMALLTVSDVRSFGIVQSQNARVLLTERCSRCMWLSCRCSWYIPSDVMFDSCSHDHRWWLIRPSPTPHAVHSCVCKCVVILWDSGAFLLTLNTKSSWAVVVLCSSDDGCLWSLLRCFHHNTTTLSDRESFPMFLLILWVFLPLNLIPC